MTRFTVEDVHLVTSFEQLGHEAFADELSSADDQDALRLWIIESGRGSCLRGGVICGNGRMHEGHLMLDGSRPAALLIVIFQSEMSNKIFTLHPPKGILELH